MPIRDMTRVDNDLAAAIAAGWNPADGPPPYHHAEMPPEATLESVEPPQVRAIIAPLPNLAKPGIAFDVSGGVWAEVKAEHMRNVGFVDNHGKNPWSEELGIGDVAYCIAAASRVPAHNGIVWPDDVQFPHKGIAYVPFAITWAVSHGIWEADSASTGRPAAIHEGDLVAWDWNGDGVADHCETSTIEQLSGQVNSLVGYNTGTPNGCHFPISRPRSFLLGVIHMCRWAYAGVPVGPAQTGPRAPDGNPFTPLVPDGQLGMQTLQALQWSINHTGGHVDVDGQGGPDTTKGMQLRLNATNGPVDADGVLGSQTVRALQAHVGSTVNGQWGADTTSHLQQTLNRGAF
jgi:hypothetical protein